MVNITKNWNDAKVHCEEEGEYFATFESLESARWLTETILANPGTCIAAILNRISN